MWKPGKKFEKKSPAIRKSVGNEVSPAVQGTEQKLADYTNNYLANPTSDKKLVLSMADYFRSKNEADPRTGSQQASSGW